MPDNILTAAIPLPLRQTFNYVIPLDQTQILAAGIRIEVPFGARTMIGVSLGHTAIEKPKQTLKPIHRALDKTPIFNADILAMCRWAANYYHHPIGEVLFAALPSLLREGMPASPPQQDCWQLTDHGKGLPNTALKRAPKQQQCLQAIRLYGSIVQSQLQDENINRATLRQLEKKSLVIKTSKNLCHITSHSPTTPISLNTEQSFAYANIQKSYGRGHTFLLDGVTGSGKTEVYLACIKDMLNQGLQSLVIVPEINLTPQFVKRFEQRLGVKPQVLHSGLSNRQRLNTWIAARDGLVQVVIGTRSALFTPFKNPGLLIVDEEHANTLKQQDGFRYSARDCVIWRGQHLNIPVILGSGTPSLESYLNAKNQRFSALILSQRAKNATPPLWQIDDIRGEQLFAGLSTSSLTAIQNTLLKNQQTLVFINRLGYAPTVQCHQCGWHAQCPLCDANQTVFLAKRQLRCNHCDRSERLPAHCPSCQTHNLQTTGQGTEQVASYLESRFSDARVVRIDSETTSSKAHFEQHLATINSGEPCIIVGTQIMAKGHDFANLSLAIIINADDGIVSASYRASEKSAQMLTQVAGRTGRGSVAGRVIVQSHYPEHPLLLSLTKNDYQEVLATETQARKTLNLPPFSFEAVFMATSKDHLAPESCLRTLLGTYQWNVIMIGPTPAGLARKAGWFRAELTLRANGRRSLHHNIGLAEQWLAKNAKGYQCKWTVDVDPVD